MAVRTYDPKKVALIVGGIPITGFADGTFISIMRSEDAFTKVSGADGEVSRAKSNDKSGEMTITLAQTSSSNDVLSALATADELTGEGVVPILVKDTGPGATSTYAAASGWIRKMPDSEFGKEISNREWVFDLADFIPFVGSNSRSGILPI